MLKFAIILAAAAVCYVHAANTYRLYTRNNRQPVTMTSSDTILPDVYNPEDKTIILIHGHGGSASDEFNRLIREDVLLRSGSPHNVIAVDWENEAKHSYSVASSNVRLVANDLRDFLIWLSLTAIERDRARDDLATTTLATTTLATTTLATTTLATTTLATTTLATTTLESTDLEPEIVTTMDNVHLVGFGLGAHVAGIASRQLELSPGLVGRITGLDPSGSGWGSNSARLRRGDANYVEVIHTDGSGLLANGIGTAIGQVNFYANGGSNQPGCFSHSCSHNRAYELFAASMRNHLYGSPCNTKTQMNLNLCRGTLLKMGGTELSKRRYNDIYRINTGRRYPF